jgi:ABC-type antimicrobial peptide transport system permease subunit
LITVLSLFLSAFLLVLMFTGILSLHQALQGTLLGDYVLLQTAVPQIAGCVIAIILTFLSVADLLLLQVRERQQEIGLLQAVGWRPGWIQRLFVQEGLTLAIIGAIPGVLVAQWILHTQHATQSIFPAPVVALGAVLLMVLVAAFAAIPALRAMSRMQVADVLRSE